ncbi:MAG: bifunctional homocysteine S-methyltransferase/methylenetetrahydrofolate reductase [Anaerolineae bacterium]|nr:bifunctional homocysteine S-methyltransferase/methylenetetrahydrofolate reductase [Anaerolineae bacterium]
MSHTPFLQRLDSGLPLLSDGAMGTQLHRTGLPIHASFDLVNLTDPDRVYTVHHAYIEAGAELIETNTFGANRYKLSDHGYGDKVTEICRAGVEIARRAVADSGRNEVYIAGAVGPLGIRMRPYGTLTKEDTRAAFAEQIGALAEAGVDAILLETFADHHELMEALAAARSVAPSLPIIAQATFSSDDRTLSGYTPARVAYDLFRAGADVIGVNCSGGPAHLANIVHTMQTCVPQARLSVMPNAGFPESVGGRVMYPATAEYFGDYALTFQMLGARMIGGCCGTTPEHINAMRRALDEASSGLRPMPAVQVLEQPSAEESGVILPPTGLAERLEAGLFTITVEMSPPRSFNVEKLVRSARLLRDAGAHILDIADTPAARMRMSPYAAAHLIQTQVGVETVLHFPTRGRNLLRIQGDLLAAHAMGLRNLFVTMGDPTKIGDYPDANDSYDIVPSKLISLIKHNMNKGVDQAGNSIGAPAGFLVGCALNMGADDLDHEIKILGNKLDAGADFALGQPVFEPWRIKRFLTRYEELTGQPFTLPVLLGVMPLYTLKHAQFLHNEVPGITIPDSIFKRMEDAGEHAAQEGVTIAQELLRAAAPLVAGAYIIPAFGKYELAAEVVAAVPVVA